MLNCYEVNNLISLYIDGELNEKQCREFEEHIDSCNPCKQQLEEMTQLVCVCRDIEEVDLPDGFAEELHMKLAAVNMKENSKTGIINFPFNRVRVISSVAAMFVLVFAVALLARSTILTPSKTGNNSRSMLVAEKSAADSAGQESEKSRMAESADSADSGLINSAVADTTEAASLTAGAANQYGSSGARQEGTANMEASDQKSATGTDSTGAQVMGTLGAVANTGSGKLLANIQIYSSDINTLAEEVDKIILTCQGEKEVQSTALMSTTTSFTVTQQKDLLVMEYKIPNARYNDFINSIITTFGQSEVVTNKPVIQDLSTDLDVLNSQAEVLDSKIKKAENDEISITDDELVSLQEERKVLEQKLSDIKSQMEYTYTTIELKKEK